MMQAHERLEVEWAAFNGLDPAGMVACSSGTAALHLAFEALQLPSGSECICPDYAMIACPRAAAMAGLRSVFVDCDERLLMDVDWAKKRCVFAWDEFGVTDGKSWQKTQAIMAVHVYGRRCDMDSVTSLAAERWRDHGLKVVEDLAEAHGVRPHPASDAACWSFQRSKIVHGEEGGAVWLRNPEHAALARRLRSLGFDHEPPVREGAASFHDYRHAPRGHNYRLANLLAEPILRSVDCHDANAELRRLVESWHDEECPPAWRMPPRDAVWVYDLRVPGLSIERQERAVRRLCAEGIAARTGFRPCSSQPEFEGCRKVSGEKAAAAAREVMVLPVEPGRTTREGVRRAWELLRAELGE